MDTEEKEEIRCEKGECAVKKFKLSCGKDKAPQNSAPHPISIWLLSRRKN
jgi:hypothetical protein